MKTVVIMASTKKEAKDIAKTNYGETAVFERVFRYASKGNNFYEFSYQEKSMLNIPGDAETLSLSDLKPETVKQVAAELLEQEKSKTRSNEKLALLGMCYGRAVIDPYATPIFDLKSFGKPIQDLDEIVKKWREAFNALEILRLYDSYLYEDVNVFAARFGQSILDAIPKKHAYSMPISEEDSFKISMKTGDSEKLTESNDRRFWPIPETGPEQIIDRSGKTRIAPDLKIETNQQWSPEELKNWLAKPEQQNRKAYVFREDRAEPGNTQQERKSYEGSVFGHTDDARRFLMAASNDGVNWTDIAEQMKRGVGNYGFDPARPGSDKSVYAVVSKDEISIRNYTPETWPATAPPYHSAEGWEYEKAMKLRNLKSMLTIEWLEKQQTEKHALIAQRLREILAA